MPMQRYNPQGVPLQRVAPIGYQAQSQMIGNLTDRLKQWESTAFERAKVEVAEEGRNQAIQDMVSGDPLRIEKGYTFYAKAYNDVSKAAFNIQVESDLKRKAEELQAQDPLNPAKFNEVFDAYSKASISNIQEPEFKSIYMEQAYKIGATYSNNMTKKAYETSRKNSLDAIKAGITDLTSSYKVAVRDGNEAGMTDTIAKISILQQRRLEAGEVTEEGIALEMKGIIKQGFEEKLLGDIEAGLSSGDPSAHIKAKQSPYYQSLSYEGRKKFDESAAGVIDRKFKSITQTYDLQSQQLDKVSKYNKEKYLGNIYLGKEVDEKSLQEDLDAGMLAYDDYKEILDIKAGLSMGGVSDDPNAVLEYTMSLGGVDIHRLKSDNRLTSKTKIDLAAKDKHFRQKNREIDAWSGIKEQRTIMGSHPRSVGMSILMKYPMYPKNPKKENTTKVQIIQKIDAMVERDPSLAESYNDLFNDEIMKWEQRNSKVVESNLYDSDFSEYQKKKKAYDKEFKEWGALKDFVSDKPRVYNPPKAPEKPKGYIEQKDR